MAMCVKLFVPFLPPPLSTTAAPTASAIGTSDAKSVAPAVSASSTGIRGDVVCLIGAENGWIGFWSVPPPATTASAAASTPLQLCNVKVVPTGEPVLCADVRVTDPVRGTVMGVSGSAGSSIAVFDVDFARRAASVRATIALPAAGVSCVAIRGDGVVFATGGWDRRVRLFSTADLTPLAILKLHTETVQSVGFAWAFPYGNASGDAATRGHLATASKDKTIAVYDLYGTV
jgi:WD40 repeat protein